MAALGDTECCIKLRDKYGPRLVPAFDVMYAAAKAGKEDVCRLAMSWGCDDYIMMADAGAENGHADICLLAASYASSDDLWKVIWHRVVNIAASRGHCDVCRVARSQKGFVLDTNAMMALGAKNNQRAVCQLAKDWGASDFDRMLSEAAAENHPDLCLLALNWGATDLKTMRFLGEFTGCKEILRLCEIWQSGDVNQLV